MESSELILYFVYIHSFCFTLDNMQKSIMKNGVPVLLAQPKPVAPKRICEHSERHLKMEQSNNNCIRSSKSLRISEQFLLGFQS